MLWLRVDLCCSDSQYLWGLRVPSYWALSYTCHRTGSWLPWCLSSSTAHNGFLIWPLLGSLLSPLATSSLRFYTLAKPWCILLFTPYGSTVQLPQLCLCYFLFSVFSHLQFSSVAQSCPTLCDPMNCSMPGFPVHHQHPECTQTHVHQVGDAIQPSHPLSSPNPSQHQGLFQWVSSSHEVAKILEFQLQHQSFRWILRTDLL